LKNDPLTNIRGAAALLRKIYDETPKPTGTTEQDIESWRYAIVKYCGVPEPDLSNRHALDVYEFMNKGYNQYGIEWPARPVNLGPMREDVKRIVAEADAKHQAQTRAEELTEKAQAALATTTNPKSGPSPTARKEAGVEIAVVRTGRTKLGARHSGPQRFRIVRRSRKTPRHRCKPAAAARTAARRLIRDDSVRRGASCILPRFSIPHRAAFLRNARSPHRELPVRQ
jgi:hypothetical protein